LPVIIFGSDFWSSTALVVTVSVVVLQTLEPAGSDSLPRGTALRMHVPPFESARSFYPDDPLWDRQLDG
jgi:hypothetical protein